MAPEGWLRDPNGRWLLCFVKDSMSSERLTYVYMDKWEISPIGTPGTFINRRRVGVLPATETWEELVNSGWVRINSHFKHVA